MLLITIERNAVGTSFEHWLIFTGNCSSSSDPSPCDKTARRVADQDREFSSRHRFSECQFVIDEIEPISKMQLRAKSAKRQARGGKMRVRATVVRQARRPADLPTIASTCAACTGDLSPPPGYESHAGRNRRRLDSHSPRRIFSLSTEPTGRRHPVGKTLISISP